MSKFDKFINLMYVVIVVVLLTACYYSMVEIPKIEDEYNNTIEELQAEIEDLKIENGEFEFAYSLIAEG